ncbi:MAG: hypothetical protein JST85_28855 [Acidobacteria bacterium]|nr:hypothetical protein [Acidobacteriota bacterium]
MPLFACNHNTNLGQFLRGQLSAIPNGTYYLQRWRVLELLRAHPGSIIIQHNGTSAPARSESDSLRAGDHVFVNLQPLQNSLPLERYVDYGSVPRTPSERDGLTDAYATKARQFLDARPRSCRFVTEVESGREADNLEAFVHALLHSGRVAEPIGDLILIGHGSAYGDLGIPLTGSSTPWTSFEDLLNLVNEQENSEELRNAFYIRPEILSPRPARVELVPATLTTPWGPQYPEERPWPTYQVPLPVRLHIRGCNLGQDDYRPMLLKLKRALGGEVIITAPKYFHYMSNLPAPNPGRFEWMAYGFRLLRKDPLGGNNQPARRAQLINAFREEARREGSRVRYYDGSTIASDRWEQWFPANLDPHNLGSQVSAQQQERVWNVPVQTPLRQFNVEARFWYRRWQGNLAITWRLAFPEDPGNDREVLMAALRESLRDPERSPHFQDDYELPRYRRVGYATFDEFMEGWDWQFSSWHNGVVTATGTRHEYVLIYPIQSRNSSQLLLNYYPANTSQQPILRLGYTDQFFAEV